MYLNYSDHLYWTTYFPKDVYQLGTTFGWLSFKRLFYVCPTQSTPEQKSSSSGSNGISGTSPVPGSVYIDTIFGPPQNSFLLPEQGMSVDLALGLISKIVGSTSQFVSGCALFSIVFPQSRYSIGNKFRWDIY